MKIIAFVSLLLFIQACGTDQENNRVEEQTNTSQVATPPVERLDPNSNPLFPAREKAPAADFEVTLLNGNDFRLSDQKGKVVLMNIWATWCPPCREETPELVALYNQYKDQGLVILGVSIDEQGESVVRPFIKEFKVSYPIYIDKDETVMEKYGPVMGIPTTYIIDKQGKIRYFAVGALTKKELEPRIKQLLNEAI